MPINTDSAVIVNVGGVGGGIGGGGGSLKFTHHQSSASTSWNINHGLGTNEVQVQVFDDTGKAIGWNEITIVDDDNITITFGAVQAGKAVIEG